MLTHEEATTIIQNLVTIHRNIHWGCIDNNTTPKRYGINTSGLDNFKFYYQVFSEYACDLDNYKICTIGDGLLKDDLFKFESDVREAIIFMIEYIEQYDIDLSVKHNFINRSGIIEVFEILDIDINDILKQIEKNHVHVQYKWIEKICETMEKLKIPTEKIEEHRLYLKQEVQENSKQQASLFNKVDISDLEDEYLHLLEKVQLLKERERLKMVDKNKSKIRNNKYNRFIENIKKLIP